MSTEAKPMVPAMHELREESGTVTENLRLILVTPARNEVDFIEGTIRAVIAQTVVPLRWFVVSDGSTDGTDDIIKRYAARYPWIELVRMPERQERHFAGKVRAFDAGFARARAAQLDYDVVGNLDADITLPENCLEFLLKRFAENSHLGVAGVARCEGVNYYDYRFTTVEEVTGACQLFRRECFREIGGYVPLKNGGIDLIAGVTARMKGWQTKTFTEQVCTHHRKTSSANNSTLGIPFYWGWTDYTYGCDPLWQLFRSVYQLTRPPVIVRGSLMWAGYLWAMLTRKERVVSAELVRFRQAEQRRRLWAFFARWLGRRPSQPEPAGN